MIINLKSKSRKQTIKIGEFIGKNLIKGSIVPISGELGAGKTTLIKGITKGLGFKDIDSVLSPSFTIMRIYPTENLNIYHFDFYRLNDIDSIIDIGFFDYLDGKSISLIEWPELILEQLNEPYILIRIFNENNENYRILKIESKNNYPEVILKRIKDDYIRHRNFL